MPVNLNQLLTCLKTTDVITTAPQAIVPQSYGNWLDPAITSVVLDFGATATPAVLLEAETWKYAINARPVSPDPPMVFYNGELQEGIVYRFNPDETVNGTRLATLTFTTNPTNGVITTRHGGTVGGTGLPITNPILVLYDLLTTRLGWTLNDFDRGICEQALKDLDFLGYTTHFCFREEKSVREILLEFLQHFHCDFTETGN